MSSASSKINNLVEKINAYEQGEMDVATLVSFFQELIDTDLVWGLQGSYGRTARSLIEEGLCQEKYDDR